ncbi:hypothetical protein [Ramlibacter sp.]|uniref:energy transducer TonB n=1 Tax=Ramlibacter sp. TaxID=1917967 RepID=UPI002613CA96|nr:hypothetical protein [Ramlibacter sp.]
MSLLLHAVLLAAIRMPRERRADEPPLRIVFTATLRQASTSVTVASAAAVQPHPQHAQLEPAPPVPVAAPAVAAAPAAAVPKPPAESPPPAVTAAAAPASTEEAARPAAPAPADKVTPERHDPPVFLTKEQWSTPPLPQDPPDVSQLAGTRIEGRKLLVKMWIDEQGTVTRAEVVPYELRPEIAALLAHTVTGVRFAPASLDGKPVASQITSRLCFDDGGQLDTASDNCWRFGAEPQR